MQITKGEYYKKLSENEKMRVVEQPAPRGKILDANGIVLADNRPSFTVQMIRNKKTDDNINEIVLKVASILEYNGDEYIDDFPLEIKDKDGQVFFEFRSRDEEQSEEEEMRWKKQNGIRSDYTAKQVLDKYRKKYNIDNKLNDRDALKIIEIRSLIDSHGYYRSYIPVEIALDISQESVAMLETKALELPGINVVYKPIRYYPYNTLACHILGYIGKIPANQSDEYQEKGYNVSSDMIGITGLEGVLEDELAGTKGKKWVYVNNIGRIHKELDKEPPIAGKDVVLTIDKKLQEVAEKTLKMRIDQMKNGELPFKPGVKFPVDIGSVVAIDVNTGGVLAMASYPNYDPNLFATGISTEDWKALNPEYDRIDPTLPRPMVNNAISGAFPPGSTFKMVTATAALQEGAIGVNDKILTKGSYTKYSRTHAPGCWLWNSYRRTHGYENVKDAIRDSCNYYFYEIGDRVGIEKIAEYAKKYGLGQNTGIELSGEVSGNVDGPQHRTPYAKSVINNALKKYIDVDKEGNQQIIDDMIKTPHWGHVRAKLKELGLTDSQLDDVFNIVFRWANWSYWPPTNTLSASIGQGDHNFTPVQLANYVATIVNGGKRYKVHLVKEIVDKNGQRKMVQPEVTEELNVDDKYLEAIKEGMWMVTQPGGTASTYFKDLPFNVGAKTGTAQYIKGKENHSVFVAFAPYEDPQIAVAIIIPGGDTGGYSADIAVEIFKEYLKIDDNETNELIYNGLNR